MKICDVWYLAQYNDGVQFDEYRVALVHDEYAMWDCQSSRDKLCILKKDMDGKPNFSCTKTLALRGLIKTMKGQVNQLMSEVEGISAKIEVACDLNHEWSKLRMENLDDGRIKYVDYIGAVWFYDHGNLLIENNDGSVVEEAVLEDVSIEEAEQWIRETSGE